MRYKKSNKVNKDLCLNLCNFQRKNLFLYKEHICACFAICNIYLVCISICIFESCVICICMYPCSKHDTCIYVVVFALCYAMLIVDPCFTVVILY